MGFVQVKSIDYPNNLTHGAPLARFSHQSSATIFVTLQCYYFRELFFFDRFVISSVLCISGTVSGTPFFFLNDIFVSEASSSWSVDNWKQLIDPLLNVRTD